MLRGSSWGESLGAGLCEALMFSSEGVKGTTHFGNTYLFPPPFVFLASTWSFSLVEECVFPSLLMHLPDLSLDSQILQGPLALCCLPVTQLLVGSTERPLCCRSAFLCSLEALSLPELQATPSPPPHQPLPLIPAPAPPLQWDPPCRCAPLPGVGGVGRMLVKFV